MHPRIEHLPRPAPDYGRFLRAVARQPVDRVPLVELAVHPKVRDILLDEPPLPDSGGPQPPAAGDPQVQQAAAQRNVRLHYLLGYDVVKVAATIPFPLRRLTAQSDNAFFRRWADEHAGPISSHQDFERFNWPRGQDVDFGPVDAAIQALPDGMALVGFCGGVLEFSMELLGLERLMVLTRRDPQLVKAVIDRVGHIIEQVFRAYCQIDSICALWLGDDLGHKHGTLLAPDWIRTHLLPWYRRYAELAHQHQRPFLLHTCGNTQAVMADLISAGIDAKHSFEDAIQPVEQFIDQFGQQVAALGGLDVHLLATGSENAVKTRTRQILEHAAPRGGYAAGSGNSITDYVSPENYLAMIETVMEFCGRL
jgi:uroporphyrinogen decarboxylase